MEKEKNCSNCKHTNKVEDEFPCSVCIHNYIDKYEPITNYDRIKSMSVEEMAEWIVGIKLKFGIESHKHDANVIISKLNEEEKQELNEWWSNENKTYTQWLLQEVSDEK